MYNDIVKRKEVVLIIIILKGLIIRKSIINIR